MLAHLHIFWTIFPCLIALQDLSQWLSNRMLDMVSLLLRSNSKRFWSSLRRLFQTSLWRSLGFVFIVLVYWSILCQLYMCYMYLNWYMMSWELIFAVQSCIHDLRSSCWLIWCKWCRHFLPTRPAYELEFWKFIYVIYVKEIHRCLWFLLIRNIMFLVSYLWETVRFIDLKLFPFLFGFLFLIYQRLPVLPHRIEAMKKLTTVLLIFLWSWRARSLLRHPQLVLLK